MGKFCESINNEPYGHFAIGGWKMGNEVHFKVVPRFIWDGEGLEEVVRFVGGVFGGLTRGTLINECGNFLLELWPIKRR